MALTDHDFVAALGADGYQAVPLPSGAWIPGRDRSPTADLVLDGVEGRSVLDIGTYYGFFACEAVRRGATQVVGLEPDADRFAVAARIAERWDGAYEVRNTDLATFVERADDAFDVVLFLNVLHHVADPIRTVEAVASLARERVVIEFPMAHDPIYLNKLFRKDGDTLSRRVLRRTRTRLASRSVKACSRWLPVIGVGNREYTNAYYFSPIAFRSAFTVHTPVFDDVRFVSSPVKNRIIAVCRPVAAR